MKLESQSAGVESCIQQPLDRVEHTNYKVLLCFYSFCRILHRTEANTKCGSFLSKVVVGQIYRQIDRQADKTEIKIAVYFSASHFFHSLSICLYKCVMQCLSFDIS